MPAPILVTGASGFIGRHLTRALADQALPCVPARRHELATQADWSGEVRGMGSVVHLAAAAHEAAQRHERARNYEPLRRMNALATEELARAAAAAGVQHFVFVSSIAVHGDETTGAPFSETSALAPRSLYGRSKLEAEERLAAVAAQTGLRITVLRPTLVYGPGNPGNFRRLIRVVQRGWPLPFRAVANRRNLTYVGNLVAAIVAALRSPAPETFIVCDREALSTPQLVRELAAGLGREPNLFAVAPACLTAAARITGRRDLARRLVGSLEADCSKICRVLGWEPPFHAPEGLRETARWHEAHRTAHAGDAGPSG